MQRKSSVAVLIGIVALAILVASGCTPAGPTGEYQDSWTARHYLQTSPIGVISGQAAFIWDPGVCGDWVISGQMGSTQYNDEGVQYMMEATIPDGGEGCNTKTCYFLDDTSAEGDYTTMSGKVCNCTNLPFVDCDTDPYGSIDLTYLGPLPVP